MAGPVEREVMDAAALRRTLIRIAHEVAERNRGLEGVALVGLRTRGVHLARRLQRHLAEVEGVAPPVGVLDITLYRDDLGRGASPGRLRRTDLGFSCEGKRVVLVDDVLFTGRSTRAALNALIDFGRPAAIQLAVLVDRGGRELPIRADFVGKNVAAEREEEVLVRLREEDGQDRVVVRPSGRSGRT